MTCSDVHILLTHSIVCVNGTGQNIRNTFKDEVQYSSTTNSLKTTEQMNQLVIMAVIDYNLHSVYCSAVVFESAGNK